MNITYILGNGFDIQLGLNSRYSDFLNEYIRSDDADSANIKMFKQYLSETPNLALWSDAEKAMGEHMGEFDEDTLATYIEQISDFEIKMAEYLEREQAQCLFVEKVKIKESFMDFLLYSFEDLLNRGKDELSDSWEAGSNTFNFITFNYTDLLDNIIECCVDKNGRFGSRWADGELYVDSLGSICHVHGTLNSHPIMGVNDESQLNTNGGVYLTNRVKRKFIKPHLNQAARLGGDVRGQAIIANSDLIVIYGISYGATDNLWWSEIRNWLEKRSSHKLIAFIRDSGKTFNPRLAWEEVDYEEDKRREVLQNLGFSIADIEFSGLMDQIYLVVNTKRLNLKEIILANNSATEPDATAAANITNANSKAI
ncbi:MAG: hypothetical protein HDT20_01475 [Oscillibacter sp.]|nr:hypothetical protein [Oscillibacter sp.]